MAGRLAAPPIDSWQGPGCSDLYQHIHNTGNYEAFGETSTNRPVGAGDSDLCSSEPDIGGVMPLKGQERYYATPRIDIYAHTVAIDLWGKAPVSANYEVSGKRSAKPTVRNSGKMKSWSEEFHFNFSFR